MLVEKDIKDIYVWVDIDPSQLDNWIHYIGDDIVVVYSWDYVVLANKNLWATEEWNSWDALVESKTWYTYQWGNNYWFPWYDNTVSIKTLGTGMIDSPQSPYSSDTFVSWQNSPYSRMYPINRNLWWWQWDNSSNNWGLDTISTTQIWRKWPCNEWYHIPCLWEWIKLMNLFAIIKWYTVKDSSWDKYISNATSVFSNVFKMPLTRWRQWTSSSTLYDRYNWYWYIPYWTSSYSDADSTPKSMTLWKNNVMTMNISNEWWFPIRPFRNL